MGWLFMQSLKGHETPKAYLNAQFTYARPDSTVRVLKSALVGLRTYYAAVEHLTTGGERSVFAVVCLVRYNPRDREGYVFGYKDMDETEGPNEDACPEAILDLLTPTDRPYAIAWRERCRGRLAARRAQAKKPVPRPGQIVVFADPVRFSNGRSFTRLEAVRLPRRRGVVFRADDGGFYRVSNLKTLDYAIEDRTATGDLSFG
jgi:hypothetical protein